MPIVDYASLQTGIADYLARDDATLISYIPDFIRQFECSAQRRLKVRPQSITTTLTPASGVIALPSDYLGYQRVTWTGSPNHDLDYVVPTQWSRMFPADSGGSIPVVFTIEGGNLEVAPSDDSTLTFTYFQRTAALSTGLNWLFNNHFDAYLFGSLAEANAFNKAVDPAGLWKARRDEVFGEIASLDFNERQDMAVRVMGCTP